VLPHVPQVHDLIGRSIPYAIVLSDSPVALGFLLPAPLMAPGWSAQAIPPVTDCAATAFAVAATAHAVARGLPGAGGPGVTARLGSTHGTGRAI
jgi:hypothetical protein